MMHVRAHFAQRPAVPLQLSKRMLVTTAVLLRTLRAL